MEDWEDQNPILFNAVEHHVGKAMHHSASHVLKNLLVETRRSGNVVQYRLHLLQKVDT